MSIVRTAMTNHPLIEAYLADLERALQASDPRERAETVAAVREHIDEALALPAPGPEGGQDASAMVRAVLEELGPVEAIASAATPAVHTAAAQNGSAIDPSRSTTWLAVASLLMAGLSLTLLVLNPFVALPLAIAALVMAAVQLRATAAHRAVTWAALAVALATILGAAALALMLLSTGDDDSPVPGPVESVAELEE